MLVLNLGPIPCFCGSECDFMSDTDSDSDFHSGSDSGSDSFPDVCSHSGSD